MIQSREISRRSRELHRSSATARCQRREKNKLLSIAYFLFERFACGQLPVRLGRQSGSD
jgi:hypothetical protein